MFISAAPACPLLTLFTLSANDLPCLASVAFVLDCGVVLPLPSPIEPELPPEPVDAGVDPLELELWLSPELVGAEVDPLELELGLLPEPVDAGVDTLELELGLPSEPVDAGVDPLELELGLPSEPVDAGVDPLELELGLLAELDGAGVDPLELELGLLAELDGAGVDPFELELGLPAELVGAGVDPLSGNDSLNVGLGGGCSPCPIDLPIASTFPDFAVSLLADCVAVVVLDFSVDGLGFFPGPPSFSINADAWFFALPPANLAMLPPAISIEAAPTNSPIPPPIEPVNIDAALDGTVINR